MKRQQKPRRLGGEVFNPEIQEDASPAKRRGERLSVYGHFVFEGKEYDIATYFPKWRFWRVMIRNFPTHMSSFIYPGAYLHSKNIDELVQGVRLYDDRSRLVRGNKTFYLRGFRAVRIWIRVYLDPFYPPRPNYFDTLLAITRKVSQVSKHRSNQGIVEDYPAPYIRQVREADDKMIEYYDTLDKRNKLLHGLTAVFRQVSDAPSNMNMDELLKRAVRFKNILEELETLCNERAEAWPNVEAARAAIKKLEEDSTHPLRKFGPRALLDGLIGVIFGVLSGGSLAIGFLFSVSSELGVNFLRYFVLSPKRQAGRLRKTAKAFRSAVGRANDFISLYESNPPEGTYRA